MKAVHWILVIAIMFVSFYAQAAEKESRQSITSSGTAPGWIIRLLERDYSSLGYVYQLHSLDALPKNDEDYRAFSHYTNGQVAYTILKAVLLRPERLEELRKNDYRVFADTRNAITYLSPVLLKLMDKQTITHDEAISLSKSLLILLITENTDES